MINLRKRELFLRNNWHNECEKTHHEYENDMFFNQKLAFEFRGKQNFYTLIPRITHLRGVVQFSLANIFSDNI